MNKYCLFIVLFISSSTLFKYALSDGFIVDPPLPGEIKCGSCPCGTSCDSSPPPPPPPPSCPPPPSPPPPPKIPTLQYCPPPPAPPRPTLILEGPQENLYPVDPEFYPSGTGTGTCRDWLVGWSLQAFLGCGLWAFWEYGIL